MTKPNHTSGPWRVGDAGHSVFGPKMVDGSLPVTIASISGNARVEDYAANARLIAAAPELLAALKAVLFAQQHLIGQFDVADLAAVDVARAVIRKAEG